MDSTTKVKSEPLIKVSRKSDMVWWKAYLVRGIAVVTALIVCAIIATMITKKPFFQFFGMLISGAFGTPRRIINLLQGTAILLGIALAITLAFKMKFWNIGAEGQVLVGALACAGVSFYLGGKMPEAVLLILMLLFAMIASIVWSVLPAVTKALWNTNETLFTLMMNYVAMFLVTFFINIWATSGSGVLGILPFGQLPKIGNYSYILNIIIIAIITVICYIYMKYSKQGYEISVVGESENTAKYIGIGVKKVIVRTMVIAGIICGVVGFLLVAGTNNTITKDLVGGDGFTAILVSWLAKFNPVYMVATSFLVSFLDRGTTFLADSNGMGNAFPNIVTGIFFLFIIASEFFINYKVKFRSLKKEKNK